MARSKPEPDPQPADGGSYLLNEATGKWIDQGDQPAVECVMPCPIDTSTNDSVNA
jgi:hypothetical protein